MAYKALYRTYRPSTFDEVAGQQHIVKTIQNALKTGKLSHAYLFTGPRGTGKTTMAKLLAKALNCEEGIGCECGVCKNCKAILDGTHPDVLELDAASNNSVDDIRELIDKVKYGTILGRYKVYIIDEVHMLSTGAFNALLKTLEEPPEHVIFILATTEPHKILPTILSRCQRYDFSKVADDDIKERLKTVIESENIEYNEKAVDLIISLCDGGMRDALSILDQVLRYSGDRLNEQDIMDVFAIESLEEKLNLLKDIANNDTQSLLKRLNRYSSKGTDIRRLTEDLLVILKDLLFYITTSSCEYLTYLNKETVEQLYFIFNEDQTLQMIDNLMDAEKDFKNVTSIFYLFQITIFKMADVKKQNRVNYQVQDEQITPIVEQKNDIENKVFLEEISAKPTSIEKNNEEKVNEIQQELVLPQEVEPVIETTEIKASINEQPKETNEIVFDDVNDLDEYLEITGIENEGKHLISDDLMIDIMVTGKKEYKNDLLDKWPELRKLVAHPKYGQEAAMLTDGHVLVVSNQILILEYPLKKNAEKINMVEKQRDIQCIISNVFQKKLFVYAVDRNDSVRLQQLYLNKKQVNKLPKPNEVNIEIEVKRK